MLSDKILFFIFCMSRLDAFNKLKENNVLQSFEQYDSKNDEKSSIMYVNHKYLPYYLAGVNIEVEN